MPDHQQHPDNGDRMDRVERALEKSTERMDRFERGLDHLLQAQAKHEAAAETRFQRIEGDIEDLAGLIRQLAEHADQKMAATDERIRRMSEETDRRFRATGEHLNTLTNIVDELIRKRPPEAPSA